MAKPPPHANNLTAALSSVMAAHDALMAAPLTHAERHQTHLAEYRKRIDQDAEITEGIARHTGQA